MNPPTIFLLILAGCATIYALIYVVNNYRREWIIARGIVRKDILAEARAKYPHAKDDVHAISKLYQDRNINLSIARSKNEDTSGIKHEMRFILDYRAELIGEAIDNDSSYVVPKADAYINEDGSPKFLRHILDGRGTTPKPHQTIHLDTITEDPIIHRSTTNI
jgi:hypothetical protein